jgi:uncharacterized protein with GYD domain
MATYLIRFSQTAETWRNLIDSPEDRRDALDGAMRELGGALVGYWYAFGEDDGYIVVEAPGNVSVAALSVAAASTGVGKISTTVLITVEEMLEALERAKGLRYRPPGAT